MWASRLLIRAQHAVPPRPVIIVLTALALAQIWAWDSAFAQPPASTFDKASVRLQSGDRVIVTDAHQQTITGRLEELSGASMRILADGRHRELAFDDVLRIERRTPDSLLNGLLIGAAIGGALFLKYYSDNALCQNDCQFVSGALGMVGMGAGAGIGLDALVVRKETVFEQPPPTRQRGHGARAAPDRAGWSVALRFEW
jgi:hypothetical protein